MNKGLYGFPIADTNDTLQTITAVASGSLSNGDVVYIDANGAVLSTKSGAGSLGTEVAVNAVVSQQTNRSSFYDASTGKVVCVYVATNAYAVVGTVSGTTISFGTPVQIVAGFVNYLGVVGITGGKCVVSYVSGVNGTSWVGTISGTTISFGASAYFDTSTPTNIISCYDSITGKVIIACDSKAIVGTVSGTSISFGTAVVYDASGGIPAIAYDIASQKVIVFYVKSNALYGIVGTVSGTSISFGGKYLIYNGNGIPFAPYLFSAIYIPRISKTLCLFINPTVGIEGVVCTITGTTIAASTPSVLTTSPESYSYCSACYDSSVQKIVVSFGNSSGVGGYLKLLVCAIYADAIISSTPIIYKNTPSGEYNDSSVSFDSTNNKVVAFYSNLSGFLASIVFASPKFGADNVIGISKASYTSGQNTSIATIGATVTNQSGLTPSNYYVNEITGVIQSAYSTIYIGKALSATSLLVKG